MYAGDGPFSAPVSWSDAPSKKNATGTCNVLAM